MGYCNGVPSLLRKGNRFLVVLEAGEFMIKALASGMDLLAVDKALLGNKT